MSGESANAAPGSRASSTPNVEEETGAAANGVLVEPKGAVKVMKRFALATLLLFTTTILTPALAVAQNQAPAPASRISIPVSGAGGGAVFTGTFQLQRFATNAAGELVANGLLTGVVTTAAGATSSIVRTVSLPAAVTQATCDILHLDLGPLDLNILGLQINLSEIVLDITAQSGAGNLLGNLLCAVANLLNNPSGLADLLNRILGALG